jgi:hypothetical protein
VGQRESERRKTNEKKKKNHGRKKVKMKRGGRNRCSLFLCTSESGELEDLSGDRSTGKEEAGGRNRRISFYVSLRVGIGDKVHTPHTAKKMRPIHGRNCGHFLRCQRQNVGNGESPSFRDTKTYQRKR